MIHTHTYNVQFWLKLNSKGSWLFPASPYSAIIPPPILHRVNGNRVHKSFQICLKSWIYIACAVSQWEFKAIYWTYIIPVTSNLHSWKYTMPPDHPLGHFRQQPIYNALETFVKSNQKCTKMLFLEALWGLNNNIFFQKILNSIFWNGKHQMFHGSKFEIKKYLQICSSSIYFTSAELVNARKLQKWFEIWEIGTAFLGQIQSSL